MDENSVGIPRPLRTGGGRVPVRRWLTGAILGMFGWETWAAAGLRVLPPERLADGKVGIRVVGDGLAPIPAERFPAIEVLFASEASRPMREWLPWEGVRGSIDGHLRFEGSSSLGGRTVFFVARERAATVEVTVRDASGLRGAVATARPGTRIRIAAGTYAGGFFFANLRGESNAPIVLAAEDPSNPPVIRGGANGMQFTDPAHVELHDLAFVGATGNGLNIDDGGTFDTPARDLVLRGLRVTDVGPGGNRDGIKLSGVVAFRVEGCTVERWGTGGSAIDMVGCHEGLIASNVFRHFPATSTEVANGVQTKGGSRNILIRGNRFEHAGSRSVNIGGSTGLEFFRPPWAPTGDRWEAKDIRVEGNTFLGSLAPIAFVGVDGAEVRYNTIYRPGRWAIRILQETTAAGFVPSRNGRFTDNLVVFHSSQWAAGGVNVGGGTAPSTFRFSRNAWYCLDRPTASRPSLPVAETEGTYGIAPVFEDAESGLLGQESGSPLRDRGADGVPP
ncbi:MAG: hypothetical protein JNL97_07950 [Verrucomicrobiales bacterium]|nr:hypothetical protein [Verrucomicrobiales bacterium]